LPGREPRKTVPVESPDGEAQAPSPRFPSGTLPVGWATGGLSSCPRPTARRTDAPASGRFGILPLNLPDQPACFLLAQHVPDRGGRRARARPAALPIAKATHTLHFRWRDLG